MATYIIVGNKKGALESNEIRSGDTIKVDSGDTFIISSAANSDIKFESATGDPSNFTILFQASNANDFDVEIKDNLDAGIIISNDTKLSDVDIKADKSLSVLLTAGNNVSLGKFEGSHQGIDNLAIGDGFKTDHDIKLDGGDNFLSIGKNASIRSIETKDGSDTIILGDGLVADDIKTGKGNDTLSIGDDAIVDDIDTDEGNDSLTIGDGATVDDIDTDKGNDTVRVGDFFTAHKLDTEEGDDLVISGSNGSIKKLDGGKGNDTLRSQTDYDAAKNFEVLCFTRRTLMETQNGNLPIETLRAGDLVRTLDHGLQHIRWIGSTRVPGRGVHAPVRVAAGALGNCRPLWVSQQHRMLLSGWNIEINFGEEAVLVAAKHLTGLPGIDIIDVPSVEYFHMLFDGHEIVFAEGIESESFHPGSVSLNTLSDDTLNEITSLFPSLLADPNSSGQSARLSLKSFESRILAA